MFEIKKYKQFSPIIFSISLGIFRSGHVRICPDLSGNQNKIGYARILNEPHVHTADYHGRFHSICLEDIKVDIR